MAAEEIAKDDLAPLNLMEYTFSEKMLFVDTTQIKKCMKIFPKIQKRDIKPFVLLSLKEMEGQIPRVGGVADMSQYVAVRSLVHTLYREGNLSHKYKPPPDEIFSYLTSLKLSPECSRELLNMILVRDFFVGVPKAIRILPTIVSSKWMIDLSYSQRDESSLEDKDNQTKIDILRRNINIILFLELSDGRKRVIGMKWKDLARLRLEMCEAYQAVEEVEETLRVQEETDKENLRIMKAEGHS